MDRIIVFHQTPHLTSPFPYLNIERSFDQYFEDSQLQLQEFVMTRFITGNGIHTANTTSNANRNFGGPNFMPQVHAILGPLTSVIIFAFCFFGAFMIIKAVVYVLVKAFSSIRQHPQASPSSAPAPRPTGCPEYTYGDYEQFICSLIAFGGCTVTRPAYWAVRDVLDVLEDDPAFFAHHLEAAVEHYFAGKTSTNGKHRFAGIVFVESSGEEPTGTEAGSPDDESRLIEAIRKTALPVQPLSSP